MKLALTVMAGVTTLGLIVTTAPATATNPPQLTNDEVAVVEGSGPVTVAVLDNDIDPDDDPMTVTAVSDGTTDGVTVTWDPEGFVGDHVIVYTVTAGGDSVDATLTVTVTADPGLPPVVVDDPVTVTTGAMVAIPVLDNDTDPDSDPLTVTDIVDEPTHGTATHDDSTVQYRSTAPYTGTDSITYEVTDGTHVVEGTITVTVTKAPNQQPSADDDRAATRWNRAVRVPALSNDTDYDDDTLRILDTGRANHGRVSSSSRSVVYEPRGEFTGIDQFTYTVGDGRGGRDKAVVRIAVRPAYEVTLTRPGRAIALQRATIAGKVTTRDGGRVDIRLQRAVGRDDWRPVGRTQVGADERFQKVWRTGQPGRERIRAVARWANGKRDTSGALSVQVEARFDPTVSTITSKDVPKTWRPGCPIGPGSLRKIEMNYWDYDKKLRRGTLIGASWAVSDYLFIFRRSFDTKFLIKKMHPVDRYGGVDERAMRAGNTSAFNCRHVTGNPYRMSRHSWGDAIDINTFENPYVTGSRVYPGAAAWRYYVNRSKNLNDPGVITANSSIARALFARGWFWGARWSNPDYQHWSATGD